MDERGLPAPPLKLGLRELELRGGRGSLKTIWTFESTDLGLRETQIQILSLPLMAVWPWASHLIAWSPYFLI